MPGLFRKNGAYWIDFHDADGVRHRRKAAASKRVALEVLNHTLDQVAHQEIGILDTSMSFAAFSKEWERRVLPKIGANTATRWHGIVVNHLRPFFNGTLKAISLARVEDYIAKRLEENATKATINRELSCLRHMMKRALAWKNLTRNPIAEWRPMKEAPGRTRFASEEEIDRLIDACAESRSPYLRPFVILALNGGLRRGEILSLTRAQIDWHNCTATIAQTKNSEQGHVPLNETAMAALRLLPIRIDGRLFPFKDGHTVSRAFRRACNRANVSDFRLHDCRHTFASYHALAGTQQRGLQALLRHWDTRMTMRYSHLTDVYLRQAVDAVNLGADKPATANVNT
jgi:integrase